MSRRKVDREQALLFAPTTSVVNSGRPRSELPILYGRQVSFSLLQLLEDCRFRFWDRYPGNWQGWDEYAPGSVQESYWRYKVEGSEHSWLGHLLHGFAGVVWFVGIDTALGERTGVMPMEHKELVSELKRKFESQWRESCSWTPETFREAYRAKGRTGVRPFWLREHAEGEWETDLTNPQNERDKARCWRWLITAVNRLYRNRYELISGAPFQYWCNIEGHRLAMGVIVSDENAHRSQGQLRAENLFPKTTLDVDGEEWRYSYAIDFLAFDPRRELYVFVDYKSGRKSWKSSFKMRKHRRQLRTYAALLLNEGVQFPGLPPLTERNLVLRAVFPGVSRGRIYTEWPYREGDTERQLTRIAEQIRLLRSCMLELGELGAQERLQLSRMLPPQLYCGPQGLYSDRNGTIREGVDPRTLVALPSMFAPTKARAGAYRWCLDCPARVRCDEGSELVRVTLQR